MFMSTKTPKTADTGGNTKTVVIVDDDPDTAELCAFILRDLGNYEVVVELDSTRAVEVIRSVQPDLVLTDVQMPEVDGLALYDLLRRDESTHHIPVLFVTGAGHDPRFAERGITRTEQWVSKPFSPAELLDAVNAIASGHRQSV